MLIDSHAHLDFNDFRDDLDAVLKRAAEAGVTHVVTVGIDVASSRRCIELARKYPNVFATVGIHPHDAEKATDNDWKEFEKLLSEPKVVAIGETGLDFYRNHSSPAAQEKAFLRQLELARERCLPVVIHCREAHEKCMPILRRELSMAGGRGSELRGVMHCFSGDAGVAAETLDLGLLISFAGPITYPSANKLRAVAKTIPIDGLLVETDCPYLAPQSVRGKRNEPANVRRVAEELAGVHGHSFEDIARITTMNARRLFRIGAPEDSGMIAYPIRDSLYLNITNRCTNDCTFCVRNFTDTVKGHNLRLANEPTVPEIVSAMGDFTKYSEVVFCGYGEPTIRIDVIRDVASVVKARGVPVRINTNGQANIFHRRNVLEELRGIVDAICISVNALDDGSYGDLCRPKSGEGTFEKVVEFVREAKKVIPRVEITFVTVPGFDEAASRRFARDLGVDIRIRMCDVVG
jgi:TatD DNase family protein